MTIEKAKQLTPEEFAALDAASIPDERPKDTPMKHDGESFTDFIKKGSERIKNDPAIKAVL